MKNSIKKSIIACLLASLALIAFGCSSGTEESSSDNAENNLPKETISLDQTKLDLTFVHDIDDGTVQEATEAKEDAEQKEDTQKVENSAETNTSGDDSGNEGTNPADSKSTTTASTQKPVPVTETVAVTDAAGQPVTDAAGTVQTEVVNVTEAVQVTDASGEPVTDAAGAAQTEIVSVTEVPVTEPQENNNNQNDNHGGNDDVTEAPQTAAYSPVYDICRAYWLDMSQEGDFFFNGEFLVIEFDVNEGIPDGHYPVTIAKTDIASWDMTQWKPECINGEVAVNTTPETQADLPASDFGLKVNSVSAKQGDTVKVVIDLANNPGFCGFVLEIQYDKNALTIAETSGGADFNKAVHYITE